MEQQEKRPWDENSVWYCWSKGSQCGQSVESVVKTGRKETREMRQEPEQAPGCDGRVVQSSSLGLFVVYLSKQWFFSLF